MSLPNQSGPTAFLVSSVAQEARDALRALLTLGSRAWSPAPPPVSLWEQIPHYVADVSSFLFFSYERSYADQIASLQRFVEQADSGAVVSQQMLDSVQPIIDSVTAGVAMSARMRRRLVMISALLVLVIFLAMQLLSGMLNQGLASLRVDILQLGHDLLSQKPLIDAQAQLSASKLKTSCALEPPTADPLTCERYANEKRETDTKVDTVSLAIAQEAEHLRIYTRASNSTFLAMFLPPTLAQDDKQVPCHVPRAGDTTSEQTSFDFYRDCYAKVQTFVADREALHSLLQNIWLPVLAGILGVLTYFSTRLLSTDELKQLEENALIVPVIARAFLGAVGGALVGILFKPEVAQAIGLTQIGLAFVLGYSVQVFVFVLDRFVKTFAST